MKNIPLFNLLTDAASRSANFHEIVTINVYQIEEALAELNAIVDDYEHTNINATEDGARREDVWGEYETGREFRLTLVEAINEN